MVSGEKKRHTGIFEYDPRGRSNVGRLGNRRLYNHLTRLVRKSLLWWWWLISRRYFCWQVSRAAVSR